MYSKIIENSAILSAATHGDKYTQHPVNLENPCFRRKIVGSYNIFWVFPVTVEVWVIAKRGVLYVVFQGSASIPDWINNMFFFPTRMTNSNEVNEKVHYGFNKQFEAVREQIRTTINHYKQQHGTPQDIVFTGHSLGGALATLSVLHFQRSNPDLCNRMNLITFGAPKVGSKALLDTMDIKEIHRFVHRNDYSPLMPPLPGYYHPNEQITFRKRKFPYISINDHAMGFYLKRIAPEFLEPSDSSLDFS